MGRPEAHIVDVSSMGGLVPVPGQTMCGASKAAVKLLTEGLYSELLGTGVRVTVVFPGAIQADISKNSSVALDGDAARSAENAKIKMTSPSEAARVILDAMERDAYRVTIGPDATMMDRLSRLMPRRAAEIIQRQMASLLGG